MENSDIGFHKSSHQSKPVSNLFTLTCWAGRVFIRYRRCLLPKTKGISNSDRKRWTLFGLVDKVGIVSVFSNTTEYYLGAMLACLEFRISDIFGWPQGMLYRFDLHGTVIRVCMNIRSVHTSTSMSELFWYFYIHINRFDIYVLMVSQIVYISWNT